MQRSSSNNVNSVPNRDGNAIIRTDQPISFFKKNSK